MPAGARDRRDVARTWARNTGFRIERKLNTKFGDLQLAQFQAMRRAYRGADGPEVLVFGDSAMYWSAATDPDHRRLSEMIDDGLGPDVRSISFVSPGYHARIVMAFLAGLATCRSRPKVVVVPTSVMMTTAPWLEHPEFGYELESAGLHAVAAGRRLKRLERPDRAYADAYDRRPAPSLVDAGLTQGELRMFIHAPAETPWQKAVRQRHRMDYYNADRLEDDSPGIRLIREMGAVLTAMELPSVAYVLPVNGERLVESLGDAASDHVRRNAALVESAYLGSVGERGAMVNAILDHPSADFIDPLHLGSGGRLPLAARISAAVQERLDSLGR